MTKLAEPSTPSGSVENSTTKATDHALQKYDNFTRYGQSRTQPALTQALPDRRISG